DFVDTHPVTLAGCFSKEYAGHHCQTKKMIPTTRTRPAQTSRLEESPESAVSASFISARRCLVYCANGHLEHAGAFVRRRRSRHSPSCAAFPRTDVPPPPQREGSTDQ